MNLIITSGIKEITTRTLVFPNIGTNWRGLDASENSMSRNSLMKEAELAIGLFKPIDLAIEGTHIKFIVLVYPKGCNVEI